MSLPLQTPAEILWMLVAVSALVVIASVVNAVVARFRSLRRHSTARGQVRVARETGLRLADGIASPQCGPALIRLIDGARDIAPVAAGLAEASRIVGDGIEPAFFDAVERSRLPAWARSRLRRGDALEVIDAIEIAEALRIESLFAELVELADSGPPRASAAATAAVRSLEDYRFRTGAVDHHGAIWGLPVGVDAG